MRACFGALVAAGFFPVVVFGQGADPLSPLLSAINFGSVAADVVAVAGLVVSVLVVIRGVRFIYSVVRGEDLADEYYGGGVRGVDWDDVDSGGDGNPPF